MIKFCPRCGERLLVDNNCDDIVHSCDGSEVLSNEDIVVIGKWEDFTGHGEDNNINLQGVGNKLFGTTAGIDGEKTEERTSRGVRKSTHRTRQHEEYIEL